MKTKSNIIYAVQVLSYKRDKDGKMIAYNNPFYISCDELSPYKSPVRFFKSREAAMKEVKRKAKSHIKWTSNDKHPLTKEEYFDNGAVIEFKPFGSGLHCRKYQILEQKVDDELRKLVFKTRSYYV